MNEEQTTTNANVTEWVSTALSPVDSPLHPRRQENRTQTADLAKGCSSADAKTDKEGTKRENRGS